MTYDTGHTEQSISRETERAIQLSDGKWVPKKLVTWRDNGPQFARSLCVPLWFAKQQHMVSTGHNHAR